MLIGLKACTGPHFKGNFIKKTSVTCYVPGVCKNAILLFLDHTLGQASFGQSGCLTGSSEIHIAVG